MASERKPLIYEFDEFSVDAERRLLFCKGEPISLTPKVFDTLLVFLENRSEVLDKELLMRELWSDSFVEEANIAQNVAVLRRALGEKPKDNKFIVTVPGRGYRFVAAVTLVERPFTSRENASSNDASSTDQSTSIREFPRLAKSASLYQSNAALAIAAVADKEKEKGHLPREPNPEQASLPRPFLVPAVGHRPSFLLWGGVSALFLIVVAAATALVYRYAGPGTASDASVPTTLAILPLKPLDASDNYLGLGVADAIIRRLNQSGTLTVRPTSAVRRYLNEETDALTAGRTLGVDAVLEGTMLRADDRLRVSVNLLRTSDGRSLWADNFDLRNSDVFAIQDKVSQQVAMSLQLRLDPAQRERFMTRYTPSAIAYEYYLKGVYSFDQRGFNIESKPQHEVTISFFKKSIEADPNYALAHAQLAYAYAWMALYIDENAQDEWVERAKDEIRRANELDPQLAETHVARHHILLSAYEGFKLEEATREILVAKQLNPNAGGLELAVAYNHLGLEDMFDRETQRTLEIDPTSEFNKRIFGYQYLYTKRYDDWLSYRRKYFDGKLNIQYLLGTGRLAEAEQLLKQIQPDDPDDQGPLRAFPAMFSAIKGDTRLAEGEIPTMLSKLQYKNRDYHHQTYEIACIYAMAGNSVEAVKWLRETASTGFPSYPLFERDHYLDRIRRAPEFVQFMTQMRSQNERARQEFER
jgi:DNA-binding winged helix-turn-helix (wHTH) protein/TolB-like protein